MLPTSGMILVMKWILPLIALATAAPSSVCAEDTQQAADKSWSGQNAGVINKESIVVRNDAEFRELWMRIYSNRSPKPDLPKVDFTKSIVVASFMGSQRTGGFSISIGEPSVKDGELVVPVASTFPVGGMVSQVITAPWAARVIDTNDTGVKVRFEHKMKADKR